MRIWVLMLALASCARIGPPRPPPEAVAPKRAPVKRVVRPPVPQPPEKTADQRLLRRLSAPGVVLLDLSVIEEYVNERLVGARHMDFTREGFQRRVAQLDRSKTYLLYCTSGARAGKALLYFRARGLKVENLGSLRHLRERGAPVEGLAL